MKKTILIGLAILMTVLLIAPAFAQNHDGHYMGPQEGQHQGNQMNDPDYQGLGGGFYDHHNGPSGTYTVPQTPNPYYPHQQPGGHGGGHMMPHGGQGSQMPHGGHGGGC